jgi:hypothetical protein
MRKQFFALCLITFALIAFSPPGHSKPLPLTQDVTYVMDQPAVYSFSNVQEISCIQPFEVYQFSSITTIEPTACAVARCWPGISIISYDNYSNASALNMRTCHNRLGVQDVATLYSSGISYQPRDGLTQAAA